MHLLHFVRRRFGAGRAARLWVGGALFAASVASAALSLIVQGALSQALRADLGGGRAPAARAAAGAPAARAVRGPGARDQASSAAGAGAAAVGPLPAGAVLLRLGRAPGSAALTPAAVAELARLAAAAGSATGLGASAPSVALETAPLTLLPGGAPARGVPAPVPVRVVALRGPAAGLHWLLGRAPGPRVAASGPVEVGVPLALARRYGLAPGAALLVRPPQAAAAGAPVRLTVAGVFAPPPVPDLPPYPGGGADLVVAPAVLWGALGAGPPSPEAAGAGAASGPAMPVAAADALVVLDTARLTPGNAAAAARGLRSVAAEAAAALPGAVLELSPLDRLAAFAAARALLWRQVVAAGLPVLLCALVLAGGASALALGRERRELALLLARGAGVTWLAGGYALEWCALGVAAAAAGPPVARALLRLAAGAAGRAGAGPASLPLPPLSAGAFVAAATPVGLGVLAAVLPALWALAPALRDAPPAGGQGARRRGPRAAAAAPVAVGGDAPLGRSGAALPWPLALGLDAVVGGLAVSAAVALTRAAAAAAGPARFGTGPWDPLAFAPAAVVLLPAALLAGAVLAFWRGLLALGRRTEGQAAGALGLPALIALRRLCRLTGPEAAAAALVALAVGSGVLAWSAGRSLEATLRRQALFEVGAPVRLREEVPAACQSLLPAGDSDLAPPGTPASLPTRAAVLCLRGGRPVRPPAGAAAGPSALAWPAPPDPTPGLPGVAAASRVFTFDLAPWPQGSAEVRYVQLDPRTYAAAAAWPAGLGPEGPAAAVERLQREPEAVLLPGGPEAVPGVGAGDYLGSFPCLVYAPGCPPRVVATPGPWPGLPTTGPPVVVADDAGPVPDLPPVPFAYQQGNFVWSAGRRAWPLAPLAWDELVRLRRGATLGPLLAALRARGVRVLAVETPAARLARDASSPSVRGRLAAWDLDAAAAGAAAVLAVLFWAALARARRREEAWLLSGLGLPRGDLALAAALETVLVLGAGLAGGLAAGTAAAWFSDPVFLTLAARPFPTAPAVVLPHPALAVWVAAATALLWWAGAQLGRVPASPPPGERPAAAAGAAAASARNAAPPPALRPAQGFRPVAASEGTAHRRAPRAGTPGCALGTGPGRAGQPGGRRGAALRARRILSAALALRAAAGEPGGRRRRALGAALGLASLVAAAVPLAADAALAGVLRADLVSQNGRPAGAVLLLDDAHSTGQPVEPSTAARLARVAGLLPRLTGLAASPTVTVAQTVTMPVAPVGAGGQVGQETGLAEIDLQPGWWRHVRWVHGRPPSARAEAGGVIEAAAEASAAAGMGLRLGGLYQLAPPPGYGPPFLRLRIVGLFAPVHPDGPEWPFHYLTADLFVMPAVLEPTLGAYPRMTATLAVYRVLDVAAVTPATAARVAAGLAAAEAQVDLPGQAFFHTSPLRELRGFLARAAPLRALLWLLALPGLVAGIGLAALAARSTAAAEGPVLAVLSARGAGAAFLAVATAGTWLPAAAASVVLAPALAFGLVAAATAVGAGFSPGVLRDLPFGTALGAGAAAVAVGLGAAILAVWPAVQGAVPAERLRFGRPPAAPLWRRLYLDALALLPLAYVAATERARLLAAAGAGGTAGGVAPALFALAAITVLAAVLAARRALEMAARALDRLRGGGFGAAATAALRRFSRSPSRWTAAWILVAFAVGQAYAVVGALRTLGTALQVAAGLQVGADAALVEGWPAQCSEVPPFLPAGPGAQGSPYQRYQCYIQQRLWGRSEFAYQLPAPPPVSFAVNTRLPGVVAATPLQIWTGTVALPGDPGAAAQIVGVDPSSFARAAWWAPAVDPLPLSAYLRGMSRGEVYVDQAYWSVHGLRPGEAVDVAVGGRTLPLRVGGPVRAWPGVPPDQGLLVVGDLGALQQDFSQKLADYGALLRLAPRARLGPLQAALQARGLFVLDSQDGRGTVAALRSSPEATGVRAVLALELLALLAAGLGGYILLLRLGEEGASWENGLLRAIGADGREVAAAAALERVALVGLAVLAGLAAGVLANRLFTPVLASLQGAGAPVPVLGPAPSTLVLFAAALAAGLWRAGQPPAPGAAPVAEDAARAVKLYG